MSRPTSDAELRRRFMGLPEPLRESILGLRRSLEHATDEEADTALDVIDRMLGKVWQRVTPPAANVRP